MNNNNILRRLDKASADLLAPSGLFLLKCGHKEKKGIIQTHLSTQERQILASYDVQLLCWLVILGGGDKMKRWHYIMLVTGFSVCLQRDVLFDIKQTQMH